jgi:hypothetical protein
MAIVCIIKVAVDRLLLPELLRFSGANIVLTVRVWHSNIVALYK